MLDLFCGAGGAAMGYYKAGFDEIVGVDINPQPHYPFEFVQADAMTFPLEGFGFIHASPPCQRYSDLAHRNGNGASHPDLVASTRERLKASGRPYIIENVPEAPLESPVILCGTMFPGLRVLRHRGFESGLRLNAPAHGPHPLVYTRDKRKAHYGKMDEWTAFVQVTGGGNSSKAAAADAMGIDWMTKAELNEAIPPAYTAWLGHQVLLALPSSDFSRLP